jgi:hypothetical protein
MKVHFGQLYIREGVSFPFSCNFQRYLAREVTAITAPSPEFAKKYGREFAIIFRISAKTSTDDNEIKGPTVFRKEKDVEYSIFLPFDVIRREDDVPRAALRYLLKGVSKVLNSLGIDIEILTERRDSIIEKVCSDPTMFDPE